MVQSEAMFRGRLVDLDGGVLDLIMALMSLKRNIGPITAEAYSKGRLIAKFKRVLRDHHNLVVVAIDRFDEGIKGVYHGPYFKKKQEFLARLQVDIKAFESIEKLIEHFGTEPMLTLYDYNIARSTIDRLIEGALRKLDHTKLLTSRLREFYQAG